MSPKKAHSNKLNTLQELSILEEKGQIVIRFRGGYIALVAHLKDNIVRFCLGGGPAHDYHCGEASKIIFWEQCLSMQVPNLYRAVYWALIKPNIVRYGRSPKDIEFNDTISVKTKAQAQAWIGWEW